MSEQIRQADSQCLNRSRSTHERIRGDSACRRSLKRTRLKNANTHSSHAQNVWHVLSQLSLHVQSAIGISRWRKCSDVARDVIDMYLIEPLQEVDHEFVYKVRVAHELIDRHD